MEAAERVPELNPGNFWKGKSARRGRGYVCAFSVNAYSCILFIHFHRNCIPPAPDGAAAHQPISTKLSFGYTLFAAHTWTIIRFGWGKYFYALDSTSLSVQENTFTPSRLSIALKSIGERITHIRKRNIVVVLLLNSDWPTQWKNSRWLFFCDTAHIHSNEHSNFEIHFKDQFPAFPLLTNSTQRVDRFPLIANSFKKLKKVLHIQIDIFGIQQTQIYTKYLALRVQQSRILPMNYEEYTDENSST